ncbi:hypothetical protein ACIP5N_21510 [Streptomyces sp. NPDC088768]|uniref:hypothetical protein n=1 Tax=Streptomyces sp. NPDC088768 TaxID=3365894 RepID=UPI00380C26F9
MASDVATADLGRHLRWSTSTIAICTNRLRTSFGVRTREEIVARAVVHRILTAPDLGDLPQPPPMDRTDLDVLACMARGRSPEQTCRSLGLEPESEQEVRFRLQAALRFTHPARGAALALLTGLLTCDSADPRFPRCPLTALTASASAHTAAACLPPSFPVPRSARRDPAVGAATQNGALLAGRRRGGTAG